MPYSLLENSDCETLNITQEFKTGELFFFLSLTTHHRSNPLTLRLFFSFFFFNQEYILANLERYMQVCHALDPKRSNRFRSIWRENGALKTTEPSQKLSNSFINISPRAKFWQPVVLKDTGQLLNLRVLPSTSWSKDQLTYVYLEPDIPVLSRKKQSEKKLFKSSIYSTSHQVSYDI